MSGAATRCLRAHDDAGVARGRHAATRPGCCGRVLDAFTDDTADLDSSRLAAALDALPDHEVAYQHGVDAVVAAVEKGDAQAGFLLRPATVAQIAAAARARQRMPAKTTFFFPKPRTGLVFRRLTG